MSKLSTFVSLAKSLARELAGRLRIPLSLLGAIFCLGTLGYRLLGQGRWSWLDCAYMTSITLTTVGYGEVLEPFGPAERLFSIGLMWSGLGVTLYAVSAVTALLVEETLYSYLRERKMEARVNAMENHFIVCGAGGVGRHVIREMVANRKEMVVIEDSPEKIAWVRQTFPDLPTVQGDATEEAVLMRAGLDRALGLVAALPDDSQNMLITVQARYASRQVKIGARCQSNNLVEKFYRAGANYVVNTNMIGGLRIASEMIRPQVVNFLDRMLRGKDPTVRVAEVAVGPALASAGHSLEQAGIVQQTGLRPIALKRAHDDDFTYNPAPQTPLEEGMVLIVIGNPEQIERLRGLCAR